MPSLKTLFLLIIGCYCMYSCGINNYKEKSETFIMPKRMDADKHDRKNYYAPYNFIVDTSSTIYFFQQEPEFRPCGTVMWWEEIRIPTFIDLKPKDILEVPINNIEEFIQLNILKRDLRHVCISSPYDTIKSLGLSRIVRMFKDTSTHITWELRKCTQEEKLALKYKNMDYNYYLDDELHLDSSKILFPKIIIDIETEICNIRLNAEEQLYNNKISKKTYMDLMNSTTDSACLEKVAKRLKVTVNYLYNFEL